jgi:hypothetical protein
VLLAVLNQDVQAVALQTASLHAIVRHDEGDGGAGGSRRVIWVWQLLWVASHGGRRRRARTSVA